MKIDCKIISIVEGELGCSVTFYEKLEDDTFEFEKKISVDKIMDSIGTYLSLNRTYPEDEFEKDYYYIEVSDFDKSGDLKNFTADLYRNKFLMDFNNNLFEINFDTDNSTFNDLKNMLLKITNERGRLTIHAN